MSFVLWAVWQFYKNIWLNLTLDFKVICIFWYFFYNLHIIDNHCGEYIHTRSKKNERGISVLSYRQFLSMCDLDLWPQGHISYLKPLFYSKHHDQSVCNLEAMMYLKSLMHVYPLLKKWKNKKSLVLRADNSLSNHHGNNSS